MPDNPNRRRLEEELSELEARRRIMTATVGDLAHQDRRLSDALERRSRPTHEIDGARRDIASGRKLAERDLGTLDKRVEEIRAELAELT